MTKVGDLFLSLKVQGNTAQINNLRNSLRGLTTALIAVQGAAIAGGLALGKIFSGTSQAVTALKNLNAQTGLSTAAIQRWQKAAQLSNLAISAEQVSGSIESLQNNITSIITGQGGNIAPFQLLGIDISSGNAFEVLDQVRDRIRSLSPSVATNLISQLGLDPNFIQVLKLSNEEFKELSNGTILDPAQQSVISQAGKSLRKIKLELISLKKQALAKIAPDLKALADDFFAWIIANREKIVSTFTSIAKVIKTFSASILGLTKWLLSLTKTQAGMRTLALIFGALTIAIAPTISSLLLLVAILTDIAAFSQGKDSVIGRIFNSEALGGFLRGLETIKNSLVEIAQAAGLISDAFSGLSGFLESRKSKGPKSSVTDLSSLIDRLRSNADENISAREENNILRLERLRTHRLLNYPTGTKPMMPDWLESMLPGYEERMDIENGRLNMERALGGYPVIPSRHLEKTTQNNNINIYTNDVNAGARAAKREIIDAMSQTNTGAF